MRCQMSTVPFVVRLHAVCEPSFDELTVVTHHLQATVGTGMSACCQREIVSLILIETFGG